MPLLNLKGLWYARVDSNLWPFAPEFWGQPVNYCGQSAPLRRTRLENGLFGAYCTTFCTTADHGGIGASLRLAPFNSMEHVKGVVCKLAHENNIDLVVSKRQQKRIESIEFVRDQREHGRQELAFNSRPFVLCGLPIRRPPDGSLKHTRRNGRFVLDVVAHPDHGLPFGQDRLIPIWVATLAVRQKSRTVLFRSAC